MIHKVSPTWSQSCGICCNELNQELCRQVLCHHKYSDWNADGISCCFVTGLPIGYEPPQDFAPLTSDQIRSPGFHR